MLLAAKTELLSSHKPLSTRRVRPTLIIAGGYTAGHITPGLALAEALSSDLHCVFMGARDGMEASLVEQAGLPFIGVPALPWAGRRTAARMISLATLLPAIWEARRELRRCGAKALVSLGSFAALAPALAAASLGLPVILYESNTTLGLANRVLMPFAKALFTSRLFHQSIKRGPQPEVIGVPLRHTVQALAGQPVNFPTGSVRVLVLGGSLGNPFLNQRMPAVMQRLALSVPALSVVHQCGHAVSTEAVARAYAEVSVQAVVQPYLDPIAPEFAAAHLVVATAGAITLHELAAAGIPSLIVPLEGAAARHQHDNAFGFTALTGCPHASEGTWDDERVARTLAELLADAEGWQACSRHLRALAGPDAALRMAARVKTFLPICP